MTDTNNSNNLLADIRELELLVRNMEGTEIYPVSFFSRAFELSHRVIETLHSLESNQIEVLSRQMEEHRKLIESINEIATLPTEPIAPEPEPIAEAQTPVTPVTPPQPAEPEVHPVQEVPKTNPGKSINELLAKQTLADFRKAFSLNDRFRFRRELFNGDEEKMNRVISDLNDLHTYEESVGYLKREMQWKNDDEAVADFMALLEKRFH